MADNTDVLGGGLSFQAKIEDSDYIQGIEKMLAASRKLHETENKRFDLQIAAQREVNNMMLSSGGVFSKLSQDAQQNLGSLSALQKEMQRVAEAKNSLNASYAAGNTSQAAYTSGISALVTEETQLAEAIAKVSRELAKSDSFQQAGNAAITTRRQEIERLEAAYKGMGAAGQQSDAGKALQANISGLQTEIRGLESAFKSINDNAFGNLAGEIKSLDAIQQRYAQIARLQNELAGVKSQQIQLQDNFPEKRKSAVEYRLEVAKVADQEKALQAEINATKAAVKASDAQFSTSQSRLKAETKELEKLKAVYAELAKTDLKSPAARTTASDISRLEKSVQRGQDAETKILEERFIAAAKLEQQYKDLNAVKVQKQDLKSNFEGQGKYITEYRAELEKLSTTEKELTATINREIQAVQQQEAVSKSVAAAIGTRIAEIKKLEQAYDSLSEVDQADPQIGGKLKSDMDGLQKQVRVIQGMFSEIASEGGNALQQKVQAIREQFTAIAQLEFDNSGMLNSLTAIQKETAELKADLGNMPAFTLEGIEQSTAQLKQLQTTYDALNDEEKLSIVGRETLTQIQGIEAELKTVDNILSNLPKLTLGEIDSKKAQVAALNFELAKLNDTDRVDINLGGAIQAQISTLNGEINKLEANVRDLPTISLGDLQTQIRNLKTLTDTFDRLSDTDKINPEIGGKMQAQIAELTVNLDKFKAGLKDIPTLTISGIEERVTQISALQKQLNALPESQKLTLGVTIEANIDKLNGEVDELKKTLGTVPELQLGQVAENTGKIIQLQEATANLRKNLTNFPDVAIQVQGVAELEKLINQATEAKARLEALPDAEQVDINIGGKIKEELAGIEAQINGVIGKILSVPDLNLELADESAKLAKLEAQLEKLSDADIEAGKGEQLFADIDKAEAKVRELQKAVVAVPPLELGNLKEKQSQLESLRLSFAQLSEAEKGTGKGLALAGQITAVKQEVDSLAAALDKVKIGNIATGGLEKVKNDFRELLKIQQQLSQVKSAKITLDTDYKAAAINADAYAESLAGLEKQERDLTTAYNKASTELKQNSDFQKSSSAIIKEKTREIDLLKSALNNLPKAAKLDVAIGGDMRAQIQTLESELAQFKATLKGVDGGNFDKSTQEAEGFKKSIQQLQIEMQSYAAIVQKSTDPAIIRKYTVEIERLGKEIEAVKNSGKEGFDALGRPLTNQLGIIQRLEKEIAEYRKELDKATDPAKITAFNRKLEETNRELTKTRNMGKEGFDEMGNSIGKTATITDRLSTSFKAMALSLGAMFGIFELIQFGRELFSLQAKAEGVEAAFTRLGQPGLLDELRRQTKGTVSDLTLMQTAVKADNFKIPMDVLGKGLAFAQKRAKDTGQEVDHLVESLVDGLGRKSALKIDNLGISLVDIQKEMKKTGDFATAVGNLMEREMAKSGEAVDGLSEKTNRASAAWENFKKFLSKGFNPGAINTDNVTKYTETLLKEIGKLDKASGKFTLDLVDVKELERQAALLREQQKAINETISGKRDRQPGVGNIQLREQRAANENILLSIQKRVDTLKEEERIAKNILSVSEMQAQVEKLRNDATNIIPVTKEDTVERQRLLKEADRIQKEIDKILGKAEKKTAEKKLDNSSYEQRIALLQKIAELETKYNLQNLTPDEQAVETLRNEFKKLSNEISKYNRDPKNKIKISLERVNALEGKAVSDLIYKQETERLKIEIERQKGIFSEYESFKTAVGKEEADARFAYDKAAFDNFGAYLESELAKIDTSRPLDSSTQDRLNKLKEQSKAYWESERDLRTQNLQEALTATLSFEQQRYLIEQRYAKLSASLRGDTNNPEPADFAERKAELDRLQALEIDAALDTAFQKTAIYKQLSKDIIQLTKDEVRARIEALNAVLENDKIPEELKKRLQAQLGDLEIKLRVNINTSYIKDLERQKALIKEALKNHNLTAAAIDEQVENLQKVNAELQKAKNAKLLELADDVAGLAGSMKEAADYMGKFDEQAGKAVNTLAQMAGNVASVIGGFASGNPFAVISGAIGLLSGFTDLMDQSEERQAANEKRQQQSLEKTKNILAEMSRLLEQQAGQIARALGVDKLDAYNKQLQLISGNIISTIKKINAIKLTVPNPNGRGVREYSLELANLLDIITTGGSRPRGNDPITGVTVQLKTLEEVIEFNRKKIDALYKQIAEGTFTGQTAELEELIKTYENLGAQLEEYKNKLREVVTGATFSGIVDSIADGFRKGMSSAEIFADNFEQLMKNAIIESLKMQALEKPLKAFYEEFARNAEDGLSSGEIENLSDIYKQIIKDAEERFKQLQDIAGIDFNTGTGANADKNSLKGDINRMTEETATVLAGQLGGMRLGILDISETAKQILAAILAPGSVNLPAAGNNTFSIPGMLEVAENGRLQTGYQQTMVIDGKEQIRLMTVHLDYARRTADSNDQIEVNTRSINRMATTLEKIERNQTAGAGALRANGG